MKKGSFRYWMKEKWIILSNIFRETYVANICGHSTHIQGRMSHFGETTIMEMPFSTGGRPDYCLDCIGKMSIKCAWCGSIICIGSPITLYVLRESEIPAPHAVPYAEHPRSFIGCLGWDCANSGADRQGFWMPPGKVERCASPLELAMDPGVSMVIVSDLSDGGKSPLVLRNDRN